MCKKCDEKYRSVLKKTEKSDDKMRIDDPDVNSIFEEGFDVTDAVLKAYDALQENSNNVNARNILIVLGLFHYQSHPVHLYQEVRESRKSVLSGINKNVN